MKERKKKLRCVNICNCLVILGIQFFIVASYFAYKNKTVSIVLFCAGMSFMVCEILLMSLVKV